MSIIDFWEKKKLFCVGQYFECTYIFYIIFFSPYFWHHKFLKETLHDIVKLKRDFQKGNIIRMKTWCKWVRNLPAGWFMVFDAPFNNISVISWWSVLLVEENVVPRENHWPVASHWQTLSHNVVSSTSRSFVKKNIQNTE